LDELINNSEIEIQKIANFLELKPTEEQLKDSFDFVHPELITSNVH
jgi:hypothetical protein